MTRLLSIQRPTGLRSALIGVTLGLGCTLTACDQRGDGAGDGGWRLVRSYDLTALGALAKIDPAFAWRPVAQMQESCGPSRTPVGLGITETEALTHGLMGAVVLELEGPWGSTRPLDRDSLEVWYYVPDKSMRSSAVGEEKRAGLDDDRVGGWVRLEPAVLPRALRVSVSDAASVSEVATGAVEPSATVPPQAPDISDSAWQVGSVRRALSLQLCLEHKLGRGWRQFTQNELEEALLMKVSEQPEDPGLAFAGQGARVPMMLGNPDACFVADERHGPSVRGGRTTRPAPYLHASDVWNGDLRTCGEDEAALGTSLPSGSVPLFLQFGDLWTVSRAPTYETLMVKLGDSPVDQAPIVSATHTRVEALAARPLDEPVTPPAPDLEQDPIYAKSGDKMSVAPIPSSILVEDFLFGPQAESGLRGNKLLDILAKVPLRYPEFFREDLDDYRGKDSRVVPLIIPAWQLLPLHCRELDQETQESTSCRDDTYWSEDQTAGHDDPVSRLLAQPGRLSVRVRGESDDGQPVWYELNPAWASNPWMRSVRRLLTGAQGERQAGYITIGYQGSGQGLSSITTDPLPGLLVGAAVIALFWLLLGLRRISDLWTSPPELRFDRWSTKPPKKKAKAVPTKAVTK